MSEKMRLSLRCYAEKEADQWQAFCIDFDLAAQADSFDEAKAKLEAMIFEYLYDALAGDDREYSEYLLSRRASVNHFLKYYGYWALNKAGVMGTEIRRLFIEPARLPEKYKHAC